MKPKGQSGMDKDELNINIRKFLKKLGIKSQREMEEAITKAEDYLNKINEPYFIIGEVF